LSLLSVSTAVDQRPCFALGLSSNALPLLQRLQTAGLAQTIALTTKAAETAAATDVTLLRGSASDLLREHWEGTVLVVGALGAVTRLIAPLMQSKRTDPAVLVLDADGHLVVPLLGGHQAGAEALAHQLAANLGGRAVLTGDCASQKRLALDAFGCDWGWKASGNAEAWKQLMVSQAQGHALQLTQDCGTQLWQQSTAAKALALADPGNRPDTAQTPTRLTITAERNPSPTTTCCWHPPVLWLGIGCERDTSLQLIERAIATALHEAGLAKEAVAGLSTIDRKGDEPALLALAKQEGWPLRLHDAASLASVNVPTPSSVVAAEMGTASVAEAAALLASGEEGRLRVPKRIERSEGKHERGAATVAIAESPLPSAAQHGELHLIGSGPGDLALLTPDARQALSRCVAWVGYGLYLDLLEPLRRADQARVDGQLTMEWERCAEALRLAQQGAKVALVSSGDSGIYAMAGLALELWLQQAEHCRPLFQVHPGISALQLAAARAGAPLMHDFCTVSLSDRLTPWEVIEQRLQAAAAGDFVVALYNPRSKGRDWQLARAVELLRNERQATTPVVLARQLGRSEETIKHTTLETLDPADVDMLTVVLIGNSTTYVKTGKMVTPRGYPGASLA